MQVGPKNQFPIPIRADKCLNLAYLRAYSMKPLSVREAADNLEA